MRKIKTQVVLAATTEEQAADTDNEIDTWHEIKFNNENRRILMSIKTKPFIILAGTSGTGKSRLARMIAYKCCTDQLKHENGSPDNFLMLRVKPDWKDPSELIGYRIKVGEKVLYFITEFLLFLVKAWHYTDIPFILCLDEMNLSSVEHYFADFLSIIESRQFFGASVISDPFLSRNDIALHTNGDDTFWERLGIESDDALKQKFIADGITIPPNLIVIGTINNDDRAEYINKRVFDRAITIIMNGMDVRRSLDVDSTDLTYPVQYLPSEYLIGKISEGSQAYRHDNELGDKVITVLEDLSDIVLGTSLQFAYRVRNEILIYCYYNSQLKNKPPNWLEICLDEMILTKVLTKFSGKLIDNEVMFNQLIEFAIKYPRSQRKVMEIKNRYNVDRSYASFLE